MSILGYFIINKFSDKKNSILFNVVLLKITICY